MTSFSIPPPWKRAFILLIWFLALFLFLCYGLGLIYPFLLAWIVAAFLHPVVVFLEKHLRLPRWLAILLVLSCIVVVTLTATTLLVIETIKGFAYFMSLLPELMNEIQREILFLQNNQTVQELSRVFQSHFTEYQSHFLQKIVDSLSFFTQKVTALIATSIQGIYNLLTHFPSFLIFSIFSLLATFFILLDWYLLRHCLRGLLPHRVRNKSGVVLSDIQKALVGFVRAQILLILIAFVIILTGLWILRVPHAITVALCIAAVDLLPYLGVGAVIIPWSIYLFIIDSYKMAIGLLILWGIVFLTRQFIEPKLVATHVGMSPLLTLIAIFVGLQIFGFIGILISPLIVIFLLALRRAHVFEDLRMYILTGSPRPQKRPHTD
ncbi:sporulation integral membrane protein YtvI [Pasteuria penetrans]|uniref:sporulation integral membrane protein YtvI n=1 Tax=Pasteuria penetrans TaxID=86005 RepID=UPI000F9320D9|nr:sporulation integral membrane protein YtvI [Pasteuria penetrans]